MMENGRIETCFKKVNSDIMLLSQPKEADFLFMY